MSVSSGSPASEIIDISVVSGFIVANGWASQAQIDRVKPLAQDGRQLIRSLVEQNIMPATAVDQLDLLIQQQAQLPNYRLIKKLGAGGMGTVYLAERLSSGERVALKVISTRLAGDNEFLSRFHRETKALVGLRHPHLANIIESGSQGNAHYLAMESVHGPSLAGMLKEYRALPENYVLGIIRQLADCLNYVYTKAGLVHRDIKPENVLISRADNTQDMFPESDQAKLIDFGLVKTTNDDEHLTQTGMTIGTPLYMSPEQVRGEKLDCRSDIYGLGATTFHLLTGVPPFRGTSPGAIMSAHLTQPAPDPGTQVPSLSKAIRRLVLTAMAKNSADRYVNYDAFIKDCDECLEQIREKNGGSIKLLRKPLVLTKRQDLPGNEVPAGEIAPKKQLSTRIQRRHDEIMADKETPPDISLSAQPAANQSSHPVVVTKPPSTSVSGRASISGSTREALSLKPSTATETATAALTKAHTEKIRGTRPPSHVPSSPLPAQDLSRSAVYAEDPKNTSGTGLIPWLILGLAVLFAIAYGVWWIMAR